MKKVFLLLLISLIAIGQGSLWAQDEVNTDPFSSTLGTDFFERVSADNIQYSTNQIKMIGGVDLKGERLTLKCHTLQVNTETKMLVAEGSPVNIKMDNVRAECKKLTYDIDQKKWVLTGQPVIYQERDGRTTKTSGDVITLIQNEEGETSVNISMNKNSTRRPEIVIIQDKTSGDKKNKKSDKKAQKVDDQGDLIKLPSLD